MITIMTPDDLEDDVYDDKIDEFEETIPAKLMEQLFARYLHTDDVQFYFEDGQYVFYASHGQDYAQKLAFEISEDRKTFIVRYWKKHDESIKPTAMTTYVFNESKNRFVELKK